MSLQRSAADLSRPHHHQGSRAGSWYAHSSRQYRLGTGTGRYRLGTGRYSKRQEEAGVKGWQRREEKQGEGRGDK
eukprot:3199932-Rhodomonas_salina.1